MQTQPKAQEKTQRQSTPQNRHSQDMMQWAMQERENLVKPQSLGRKRYVTDEDEAFRQGFFGEDYKDNEELQQRVNSAMRDIGNRRAGDTLRTYLAPENNVATRYAENASDRLLRKIYDIPEPGRYGWLSSEEGQKALDGVSLALSAGSLIPGVDTFTDMASIPVDLLRGDYMSAAFDAVGLIPFVGEVGDTAKLARIGANAIDTASDASRAIKAGAEVIENADDAIDFAKYTDDIYDSSKNTELAVKTENRIGELAKPYPMESLPDDIKEYISRLPRHGDVIETDVAPDFEKISLMARQEAVEFASISVGEKNYVLRGDIKGTPIPQNILDDMIQNKGTLNCHSHPYIGDLQPSKSDLELANILPHQEEFIIVTPDNMKTVYTKEGIKYTESIGKTLSHEDILEIYKLFGG